MAAIRQRTRIDQVAVGQQHRAGGFIGSDSHPISGHDVGAVGKVGDAAKAFRLALGAENAARLIQPFQLGIRGRCDPGNNFQFTGIRRPRQADPTRIRGIITRPQSAPVQSQ